NFPTRFKFEKFRSAYPGAGIRLGVIHDDLQFQCVAIQSPVAFRQVHLLATRISIGIDPWLVIESDRVDHKRVALPLAHRIAEPTRIWIFWQGSSIGPNGAPKVKFFEEHENSSRNLNDLKRVGENERFRNTLRFAAQRRIIFLSSNSPGAKEWNCGVKPRLSPGRQGRPRFFIYSRDYGNSINSLVRILHPNSAQISRQGGGYRW